MFVMRFAAVANAQLHTAILSSDKLVRQNRAISRMCDIGLTFAAVQLVVMLPGYMQFHHGVFTVTLCIYTTDFVYVSFINLAPSVTHIVLECGRER